ncbi:MAG: cytochrome P450 [Mycolicibacterium sp.]
MSTFGTFGDLVDRAKHRMRPSVCSLPGMGLAEEWLLNRDWKPVALAEPPGGSGLKPVLGDAGLPGLGHVIEIYRGGPEYGARLYQNHGPLFYAHNPGIPVVLALGPDATQIILANRNRDFSQQGWGSILGPFFRRGILLLDFDEHTHHRRIIQQSFTRPMLVRYAQHINRIATAVMADDWVADNPRFLLYPAAKKLVLKIGMALLTGREVEIASDEFGDLERSLAAISRAPGAFVRFPVPPLRWWAAARGRKLLEEYFATGIPDRRGGSGTDIFTVLCNAEDEAGNLLDATDIVNHMIFLMFTAEPPAATIASMAYWLAAHPDWQDQVRDESSRLGDAPLRFEDLEKLETLDRVMNESLRLDTPLLVHFRRTVRDTELLGHYLPAGTDVACWPSANHRLPELWTSPQRFDPNRFAQPRAEHTRHRYAFAPFGGGAHKCIGMALGQLEVKIVMHHMLRRFRLELPYPSYRARWDYSSLVPSDGMPIVLRPLNAHRR